MPKKLTTNEIIKQFRQKHGNRYCYDLVKYNGDETYVVIKCYIHGFFNQILKTHKKGQGSPKCGELVRLQKAKLRKINEKRRIYDKDISL